MLKSFLLLSIVLSALISIAAQDTTPAENRTTTARTVTTTQSTTTTPVISSTTTISPPTTTPTPETPARKPDFVIQGAGGNCLLFAGNVTFSMNYMASNGSNITGEIQIPKSAKVTGNCTDFTNRLVFTWPVKNNGRANPTSPQSRNINNDTTTNNNGRPTGPMPLPRNGPTGQAAVNMITFLFIKKPNFAAGDTTGMSGTYSLTAVFGTVVADFADAAPGQVFRFQGAPDTKIEMDLQAPYKCAADQKNIIADATGQTHMSLSDVQIEAFRVNATTPEFTSGGETLCSADKLAFALPIVAYVIVGLAILGAVAGFTYHKLKRAGYSSLVYSFFFLTRFI